MSITRRKILFFTPYATRTGSEMMIYYILKYLDRSRFEAGLVCFSSGELLNDIPKDIPVFYAPRNFTLKDKISFHLGFHPTIRALKKISRQFNADLWYVNTVMLSEVVTVAKMLKIPVITHVHELSAMYSQVSMPDFKIIVQDSDLIIGCSDIVCQCMQQSGAKNVRRLHSFVDLQEIKFNENKVREIRKAWKAEPDDYVWVMSGTTSDRKGFDMLPDIAQQFPTGSRVHLVWVGNLGNDGLVYWTKERCKNITNVSIHLTGSQKEDYYSYIAAADGFMLTSRQEPFGLVMVEAAWLGKPIVAFESGGPSEFVTPELGTLVPNLDIPLFVDRMLEWSTGEKVYHADVAHQKALEFNAETKVLEWQNIISQF